MAAVRTRAQQLHVYFNQEEMTLLMCAASVVALPVATWARSVLVQEARRVLKGVSDVVDR